MTSDAITATADRKRDFYAIAALAGLVLAMFYDILLAGNSRLLSCPGYDVWAYFYWVRCWGFDQLAQGNLPLWNPHIYSGVPFFGNFQSALLYPPNWIFLALPTAMALNWSFVLHIFLAGLFTYIWCRRRNISREGSVLAGTIYMFCGPLFFKILAGHPTFVCAAPWIPVILLCIDALFQTGRLRWSFLGAFAVCMQVLCGSPQFAYYTALAAGLYTLLNLLRYREHVWQVMVGSASIYVLGSALCAIQVLPGLQLAEESIRANGMGLGDASYGALPPAGFMTLLAPYLYAGREGGLINGGIRQIMLNVGVAGLVLAIYGAVRGQRSLRRFSVTMVVVLCVLSLGYYTPLYKFLYHYLPRFNNFRVVSRFGIPACLFLALLAGIGFDRLRLPTSRPRRLALFPAILGLLVTLLAASILLTATAKDGGVWGGMLRTLDRVNAATLSDPQFLPDQDADQLTRATLYKRGMSLDRKARVGWKTTPAQKARHSGMALLFSAGLFIATALLLWGMHRWQSLAHGLVVLAIGELFLMATFSHTAMHIPLPFPSSWQQALKTLSPDERTYQTKWGLSNRAMAFGTHEASGYEAALMRRYAKFSRWAKQSGGNSNEEVAAPIEHLPGVCQMLRIKYILAGPGTDDERTSAIPARRPPLQRVELVDQYTLAASPKAALNALGNPQFDPKKTVILESEPAIRPHTGGAPGSARVVKMGTDWMEIEADTDHPTLLLVTETYSKHWKARALTDSSQKTYDILPANYLLRAVPLDAGHHHLRMEYRPSYFVPGLWISLSALGVYVVSGLAWATRRIGRRLHTITG